MASPSAIRNAQRASNIVALLEHKPGPGIYSRLERAVQQLPENVRVQELPGLLKRYKDGIPGWELKAVDFDSVVAGRSVVPRDELLAAVREQSPVFTLKNVILQGGRGVTAGLDPDAPPPVQVGGEGRHGDTKWWNYGLGGPDYQERLLLQQEDPFPESSKHWQRDKLRNHFTGDYGGGNVASHLRTDRNDDALRIVELQSDVQNQAQRMADPASIPFEARDFWQEMQLKSALLDAARGGYRAVEVADPGDISRVVGFPADKSEKYYGNMIPQLLERQGKKLGGWESTSRPSQLAGNQKFVDDTVEFINSTGNQERAAELHDRVLDLAGTDDIHAAEEILRSQPELISNSALSDAEKTEVGRYLDYADLRATVWDNTGAEDFYSAVQALSEPNWRQQYGFNGLDATRVGALRKKLGLEDSGGFDPNLRGDMGSSEVALRHLDDSSEDILNNIQRRIMQEVDGTDRTVWQATSGSSDSDLRNPRLPPDAETRLQGLVFAIQTAGEARARDPREIAPRSILAERASGKELYDRLVPLLGEDRAGRLLPQIMGDIEQYGQMRESISRLQDLQEKIAASQKPSTPSGWRGVISDEMRKRIINEGIPAAIALGVGTGLATGGNEAEAGPLQSASDAAARAAMPWQTERSIRRLKKQVDAAYAKADQTQRPGDFKKAEQLDAKLETQYEKWDSKLEDLDEGDGDVDLEDDDPQGSYDEDMEPENYDADIAWTDEMANVYGRAAVAKSPSYAVESDADLANALRGVLPDTARANKISDEEIIAYAKDAFEKRQAHLNKIRAKPPEDGIRAMKTQLRDAGLAATMVPAGQAAGGQQGAKADDQRGWGEYLSGMLPDFSMAISPSEWQAFYDSQEASGIDPEHMKFRNNVVESMGTPSIRVGAAKELGLIAKGDDYDRLTPAQFVGEYLDRYAAKIPEEGRSEILNAVVAKLDGTGREQNPLADRIVGAMMTSLKESSPQGRWAKDDPMTHEQLESLRREHGDWADSMLTPGSAENFESLRSYELLRTTLDGEHAPVYADTMSNTAAFVGGFLSPEARRDFADVTLQSGPLGRMTRANREYFDSRTREGEPAAFRNPDGSSRFATTSATNVTGLMRAGGDTSTTLGKVGWPIYRQFSEFSRTPVGKAFGGEGISSLWSEAGWSDINQMAKQENAFDREQQVIPAGMSLEEFRRQRGAARQDRDKGEAWGATLYPNVQNFLAEGKPKEKTWGPPLFNDYGPKFLQNTVGNIPSLAIMGASAATGGLAGLAGAAFKPAGSGVRSMINAGMGLGKGAAKGVGAAVGSQVADAPFDFAQDQLIGAGIAGIKNFYKYQTTPEEENALLPDVDPNSISIDELNRQRQKAMEEREQQFQSNKFRWGKQ